MITFCKLAAIIDPLRRVLKFEGKGTDFENIGAAIIDPLRRVLKFGSRSKRACWLAAAIIDPLRRVLKFDNKTDGILLHQGCNHRPAAKGTEIST